jgi:hypothetical protein
MDLSNASWFPRRPHPDPLYVTATACMKGRVLQVRLAGLSASTKRDEVIGLLKAAASRL